jgi:hypothetical protein
LYPSSETQFSDNFNSNNSLDLSKLKLMIDWCLITN